MNFGTFWWWSQKLQITIKVEAFMAAVARTPNFNEIWSFLVAVKSSTWIKIGAFLVAVAEAPNLNQIWSFLVAAKAGGRKNSKFQ